MWGRIVALVIKEFHSIWRDGRSRMVLILPPILQLFLFAYAATLDVKNVTLGILNRDNGAEGVELVQRFIGSPTFNKLVFLESVEAITPFIDNQRGAGVLSIDQQFSRNLEEGNGAEVQLILDGRRSNTTQIMAGYIGSIVNQFNQDRWETTSSTNLIARNWFNPNLLYYWYTVPCLCGILVMLEALIITALSVARERELGTFDQLLVSPAESLEIMLSKAIPSVLISMGEGTIILLFAILFFKIPFTGSFFLFYLAMFFFVCCIVGVGLFISSLCFTQQQAILGSSLFMTPSVVLSGFAAPIHNMPEWLQPFTYLVPLRYFLTISKGIFLKSMPAWIVWVNIWPLIVIALVMMSWTTWFFRHRLQ